MNKINKNDVSINYSPISGMILSCIADNRRIQMSYQGYSEKTAIVKFLEHVNGSNKL